MDIVEDTKNLFDIGETTLIQILECIDEDDLRNVVKSSNYFYQVVDGSSKLKKKFTLYLDAFNPQNSSNPEFYQTMEIRFSNVIILNWRIGQGSEVIINRLNELSDSLENVKLKFGRFEDSNQLLNLLQVIPKLKSLAFESCYIVRSNDLNIINNQISALRSVSFDDCAENIYKFFHNQVSIEILIVLSNNQSWNGFPHEEFNDLVISLPLLKHLKFIGEGTGSYFDRNYFPFRIQYLEADTLTYNWYIGIEDPRINFLKTQVGSLKELRIKKLPSDFDGGKVLKFIIEEMHLTKFYYGKILLINMGRKQDVKRFSATDTQIEALLEMLRQFTGIEFFTLILNDEDPAVEEIEQSIIESGKIFSCFTEFELINQNNYKKWPNLYKIIIKKFPIVKITSFAIQNKTIEIFFDQVTSTLTSNDENDYTSHDEALPFDILIDGQVSIKKEFILEYSRNDHKFIKEEAKVNCRFIKFTQDWKFIEIFRTIAAFQPSSFPNLLAIIFDVIHIQYLHPSGHSKRKKINGDSRYSIEYLLKILSKFSKNRPFIVQWTSKNKKVTKLCYKDENSNQFFNCNFDKEQPTNIKNFKDFYYHYIHTKTENFEVMITEALPNIKNLSLIWKFLKTLELPSEFYIKVILKCAEIGTKDCLLTVLGASYENGNMSKNNNLMTSITSIFKLDLSKEQSILSVAVNSSNVEVVKYLIDECAHLISLLPFYHKVDISTTAYKQYDEELLGDLVEFCTFPFPKEFNATSDRLKNIIKERDQLNNTIKSNNFGKTGVTSERFLRNKIINSDEKESALYQIVKDRCLKITNFLKTADTSLVEKRNPKKTNFSISNTFEKNTVELLVSKSSVHVSRANNCKYKECHEKIRKWYNEINEMEFKPTPEHHKEILQSYPDIREVNFGKSLLKIVSSCDKLRIVFDFENNYTNKINNISGSDEAMDSYPSLSTFNELKWIFIGVQIKVNNREKEEIDNRTRGTIAHELCHYAMNMVFKNNALPYYKNMSTEIKLHYQNVIEILSMWLIEQPKNQEGNHIDQCANIISCALLPCDKITNGENARQTEIELIVRVVEMMAYYNGNKQKIQELGATYAPLINFYAIHVNQEFTNFNFDDEQLICEFNKASGCVEEMLKMMQMKHSTYIKLLSSKDLSRIAASNITIISTNIPKLFLYDVYNNIHPRGKEFFNTKNVMVCAEKLRKTDVHKMNSMHNDLIDIMSKTQKLNIFIDCSKTADVDLDLYIHNKTAKFVYIVDNQDNFDMLRSYKSLERATNLQQNYSLKDLEYESQKFMMTTKIFLDKTSKINMEFILHKSSKFQNDLNFLFLEDETLLKMMIEKPPVFINDLKNMSNDDFNLLYQPRKFITKNMKKGKNEVILTLDELLAETANEEYVIIKDEAATGKSWSLRAVGNRLREENSTKWISYIELHQHAELFGNYEKKLQSRVNQDELDFATFLADHIISTEYEFEKMIFKRMYEIGKVVILFDGFDEIVPNCATFVSLLVESFDRKSGNQLWISTRNNFDVILQRKSQITVSYRLNAFSKENGIELISKIWALKDLRNLKCEINSNEKFMMKFNALDVKYNYRSKAKYLVEKVNGFKSDIIGNTQLYKIIADIEIDKIDSVHEFAAYSFYDRFITKHCKIWIYEKDQMKKKNQKFHKNSYEFHQRQALIQLFPEHSNFRKMKYHKRRLNDNDIIGCGLMTKSDGKFCFIHRTFAEYFVAKFAAESFVKILKHRRNENGLIKLIIRIFQDKNFVIVLMFMNEALNEKLRNIEAEVESGIKVVEKISYITENLNIVQLISGMQNFYILGKILNLGFRKKNYEKAKKLLLENIQSSIKENFLAANKSFNILKETPKLITEVAESFLDVEVFEFLIDKISENYGSDLIKNILTQRFDDDDANKLNILQILLISNGCDSEKFLHNIKIVSKYFTTSETMKMLLKTNNNSENIIHLCIRKNKNCQILASMWKKLEDFFKNCDSLQIFRKFILQTDANKKTILHHAARNYKELSSYQFIWKLLLKTFEEHREELWDFVNLTVAYSKPNFFHELVKHSKLDIMVFTLTTIKKNFGNEKLLNILQKCDKEGKNVLHYAACCSSSENFDYLINELQKLISHDNIKILLSNLNFINQNLLQSALRSRKSFPLHKSLWNCLETYFTSSEILSFITHYDQNECNLLYYALTYNIKKVIEFTWNMIQKTINDENQEMKKEYSDKIQKCDQYIRNYTENDFHIMKSKGETQINPSCLDLGWIQDRNLWIFTLPSNQFQEFLSQEKLYKRSTDFIHLARCPDLEIHKISWKFLIEKFEDKNELKNLIWSINSYGGGYISLLFSSENLEIIKFTMNGLCGIFNRVDLKEILSLKDFRGRNLLQTATCNSIRAEAYKVLWGIFTEYFSESEIEKFIEHADLDGNNLLLCAARWSVKEVFEFIWTKLMGLAKSFIKIVPNLFKQQNESDKNILHLSIKSKDREKFEILWTEVERFFSSYNSSKKFREFVMQCDKYGRTILHYAAESCKIDFYETLWKLLLKTFEKHYNDLWIFINQVDIDEEINFIFYLIKNNDSGIIEFTLKTIIDIFGSNKFLDLLNKCNNKTKNVLNYAARKLSKSENFETLVSVLQKLISLEDMKRILSKIDEQNRNLLQSAAEENKFVEVHESLWDCFKKYFDSSEILNFIKDSDEYGKNCLQLAFEYNTVEVVKFIFSSIKNSFGSDEILYFLKENNEQVGNIIQFAAFSESIEKIKLLFDELALTTNFEHVKETLNCVNEENRNILQSAAYVNKKLAIHKCLWNFYEKYFKASEILKIIGHRDRYGNNILHIAAIYNTKEVVEFIWNQILTTISDANKEMEDEYVEKLYQIEKYIASVFQKEESFSNSSMTERQIDFACLDLSWIEDKNLWKFKLLADQFQVYFNQGKLFESLTNSEILAKLPNFEIHKISWKVLLEIIEDRDDLKSFLLQINIFDNNYIFKLVRNDSKEIIKSTLEILCENLSKTQMKKTITSKDLEGRNLLQTIACSTKNFAVFDILWNILSKYFDELEMQEITEDSDSDRNCILLCAARSSTIEVFKKIFTESKIFIPKLVKKQNIFGENILHLTIKSKDKEKLKFLWTRIEDFFKSCGSSQNFRKFIMQEDLDRKNILHIAAENCSSIDFHETVWKLLLKTFENNDDLWNFINESDEDGRNLFHFILEENVKDIIKYTFKIIKDRYGTDKFLDILGTCAQNKRYSIKYSACLSTHKNFEFLIEELANLSVEKNKIRFLKNNLN